MAFTEPFNKILQASQWKFIFLCLFIWSCSLSTSEAQTVYITKTGAKYHTETCRYLSNSKIPIALSKAKEGNYEACKVCKPSTKVTNGLQYKAIDSTKIITTPRPVQNATTRQCSATAKSTGNRCKRTTKNASGKCWQHE
ncbi:hypothetical protein [Marivirga lumbricoides]